METTQTAQSPATMRSLLLETVDISDRAATLKMTYVLLGMSIASAIAGGYAGATSPAVLEFFTSLTGLLTALVLLNAIPALALWAARSTVMGLAALAVDGFVSGIVISPALALAASIAPEAIWAAGAVTGTVFLSVTGYVFTTRKAFSAPAALTWSAFLSIAAGVIVNHYVGAGILGLILNVAIACFGVFILVLNTSRVVRDPVATGAVPGALLLFAGIFNVFTGVLNLILRLIPEE